MQTMDRVHDIYILIYYFGVNFWMIPRKEFTWLKRSGVSIPELGRSLSEGIAIHSCILNTTEIYGQEKNNLNIVHGVAENLNDWATNTFTVLIMKPCHIIYFIKWKASSFINCVFLLSGIHTTNNENFVHWTHRVTSFCWLLGDNESPAHFTGTLYWDGFSLLILLKTWLPVLGLLIITHSTVHVSLVLR